MLTPVENLNYGYGDVIRCLDGQSNESQHTILCSTIEEDGFVRHFCWAEAPGDKCGLTSFGDTNELIELIRPYNVLPGAFLPNVFKPQKHILPLEAFVEKNPKFVPYLRQLYADHIPYMLLPLCLRE